MHTTTVCSDAIASTVVEPDYPDYVVLETIATPAGAIADLVVSPDGASLVATHYGTGAVSVVDTEDMAVAAVVPVHGDPMLVTATGQRAYVAASAQSFDSVTVLDTESGEVVADHRFGDAVTALAVSQDGTRIVVGQVGRTDLGLAVINTFGRITTIDLGDGVGRTIDAVRVSPNGRLAYVATSDAACGALLVVDVVDARVLHEVAIASPIRDIALSRDGGLLYVASFHSHWGGSVDIVDTAINEITAKVGIGGAPMQMTLSADGARVYIADYEHVAVLCTETNSVIDRLTVTAEPSCVAVSPDGSRLYIADHSGDIAVLAVAADELETELMVANLSAAPELRALEPAGV